MDRIYIDNDHVVRLPGLRDDDGTVITGATVEARVLDRDKQPVSGVTWSISLTHTGDGDYEGVLDSTLVLTDRTLYYVEVTARYNDLYATWRVPHVSAERT